MLQTLPYLYHVSIIKVKIKSIAVQLSCTDGIHLKQCVTLYLFALPFTLVNDLHWAMIPIVTVVAFTLMGIEGIANQIEMPFGEKVLMHML